MHLSKAAVYFGNGIGNLIEFTSALQAVSSWWCHGDSVDVIIRTDFKDNRIGAILDVLEHLDMVGNILRYPTEHFHPEQYKFLHKSSHGDGRFQIPGFTHNGNLKADWRLSKLHETEFYTWELFLRGYRGPIFPPIFPSVKLPVTVDSSQVNLALCNGTFKVKGWFKKQWPEKNWHRFINTMTARGYDCWWLGGDTDKELGQSLVPSNRNLAGKITMTQSGAIANACAVTISTDTALAHAAGALGLDQIILWNGTLLSKNRPVNQRGIRKIIRVSNLSCSPCMGTDRFDRCSDYRCMSQLEPVAVVRGVDEILKLRGRL